MGCIVICLKNEVRQILRLYRLLVSLRERRECPYGIVAMIICVVLTFLEKSYSGHPNDITVLVHVNYEFLDERSANSVISVKWAN